MLKIPILTAMLLALTLTPIVSFADSDKTVIEVYQETIQKLNAEHQKLQRLTTDAQQKVAKFETEANRIKTLITDYEKALKATTQKMEKTHEAKLKQIGKAYQETMEGDAKLTRLARESAQKDAKKTEALLDELGTSAEQVAKLTDAVSVFEDRVAQLEESVTGSNRFLTFSSFVNLDQKAVIKPGEEWIVTNNPSTFVRGPHRFALWVNVAGHPDKDQSTTVEISQYFPGNGQWYQDSKIGHWIITGRDWQDNYLDLNVSKISNFVSYHSKGIKVKNIGAKTLEIFAYAIIQEPIRYIQR